MEMHVKNCQLDASSQEVKCLKEELENLRKIIKSMRTEKIKLEKENHYLQKQLEILSLDHSTHLFENDQNRNERKRLNSFQQIFEVNDQSQPTSTHPPVVSYFHGNDNVLAMAPSQDERISTHLEQFENPQSSATTSDSSSYSVQVDDRTPLLMTAQDTSNTKSAVGIVYKMYELLILALSYSLLQRDIKKIKEWASTNFSIQNNLGAKEIFLKLEEKQIINFADLSQLCNFLRTILRFDLVNVIENYETGNYTHLKKLITEYKARQKKSLDSARWSGERGTRPRLAMTNGNRTYQDFQNMAVHTPSEQTSLQRSFPQVLGTSANNFKRNAFNPILQPSIFDHSHGNERGNNSTDINVRNRNESSESSEPEHNVNTSSRCVISSSGLINTEGHMQNALQVRSAAESNIASSSNQRSAHSTLTQQARNVKWLCTHYKRRCYVKFQCCDKYWPCHRCHNNQSNCGQKKLKSRDVKMVKCAECGKEQQVILCTILYRLL